MPWFNLSVGVSPGVGAASSLSVNLSFYGRIVDGSDLQQAISGTPSGNPQLRETGLPVSEGASGLGASTCVTVVPSSSASVPATGDGICAAGSHTLSMDCQPLKDDCAGVYPVSVSLVRQGSSTPISRFTTFLTYQQPNAESSTGGALRVGVVVPVTASGLTTMADALTDNHDVATTLAVSPLAVSIVDAARSHDGTRALAQLEALSGDEMLGQPYVPVNLAALTEAGLSGEIPAQLSRGDDILRTAGLKPDGATWVDTISTLAQGDAASLASGLQAAGASQAVVSDSNLASAGVSNYTFAQPFTLDLGHGATTTAAAADSNLSARFTATPGNPRLGAEQLLAGLSFVHFENAFLNQPRGVVVSPPSGWHPSAAFMDVLLAGLNGNPALKPVTLGQYFAEVPVGGNHEPGVRQLQSGAAEPRHHAQRGRPDRPRPPRAGLVQLGRRRAPLQPDHARRHALDHRGTRAQRGRALQRVERLRQVLRRHHRAGHARHRTHGDLHVAAGRHPRHRALLGALPGDRGGDAEQRQVHVPRRQHPAPDPRPSHHLGPRHRPGPHLGGPPAH